MPEVETTIHAAHVDLILMTPAFFETTLRGDQAQAAHFGFVKTGEQMDEEDGLEEVYERRVDV